MCLPIVGDNRLEFGIVIIQCGSIKSKFIVVVLKVSVMRFLLEVKIMLFVKCFQNSLFSFCLNLLRFMHPIQLFRDDTVVIYCGVVCFRNSIFFCEVKLSFYHYL